MRRPRRLRVPVLTYVHAAAPVAVHCVAQQELVEQTVERTMETRRASAPQLASPVDAFLLPILPPPQWPATEESTVPPVPPNSFVEPALDLCRTVSRGSSSSSRSTASSARRRGRPPASDSKTSTIRASAARTKTRPPLPSLACPSFALGSPCKAPLAPPAQTLLTASSSSPGSSLSSSSAGSPLFDAPAPALALARPRPSPRDGEDTCATTPSRRGSGSSEGKKKKRVSFAGDAEAPALAGRGALADWRQLRRKNPLLEANPLRCAVSVSPKDRVTASSLPPDLLPARLGRGLAPSHSTPTLAPQVVDTPGAGRAPGHSVAMWPEDEKRATESVCVHGALLRGYARRFAPREGRSLVRGRLLEPREAAAGAGAPSQVKHERQADSHKAYWRAFEEREAEARARRKAEAAVVRAEEEKVISELLGGTGMREEDQPQARRMKRMAYDGMPGPGESAVGGRGACDADAFFFFCAAELRGLTYKFDRFLYPLMQPKPTIVEKTVRRWDEERREWVEEVRREEVYAERKKLFNFVED